jgi:hypothetical protein
MYFVELGIFILSIIVFFVLAIDNLRVRLKASRLNSEVNQSVADYIALSEKMEEALKNNDEQKIEQTEGFLKFVSESRDWAFQYIERVQIAIKNFQDVFHPIAEQYYKDKKFMACRRRLARKSLESCLKLIRKLIEELPDEGKKK